jgi:hypothetical protein
MRTLKTVYQVEAGRTERHLWQNRATFANEVLELIGSQEISTMNHEKNRESMLRTESFTEPKSPNSGESIK